jgi:hypothetical protein
MFCFELDAAFDFISERTQADPGMFILCPVMKTVNPSEVAFRDQLRFGRQPVLYIMAGLRSLVDIIEVCPSGHFIRRWHKTNCALVQVPRRSWG